MEVGKSKLCGSDRGSVSLANLFKSLTIMSDDCAVPNYDMALAGLRSGLECHPDTPGLQVQSQVRAHTRTRQ